MKLNRFGRGPLTPDLEELHAELASIEIEERQSFAPELRAELESAHRKMQESRPKPRPLLIASLRVAAAAAALAVVSVPGARASLVKLVTLAVAGSEQPRVTVEPQARFVAAAEDRRSFVPKPASDVAPQSEGDESVGWASEPITSLAPDIRYPSLRSQEEARAIVKLHYPRQLQRRGVHGTVRLILWVDESGKVLDHEVVRASGVERLDQAALAAAPKLRFTPARRQGEPVGTWVEFDIIFQPPREYLLPEAPVVAELGEPQVEADLGLDDDVRPPVLEGEGSTPPVVSRRGNGGIRALNW